MRRLDLNANVCGCMRTHAIACCDVSIIIYILIQPRIFLLGERHNTEDKKRDYICIEREDDAKL